MLVLSTAVVEGADQVLEWPADLLVVAAALPVLSGFDDAAARLMPALGEVAEGVAAFTCGVSATALSIAALTALTVVLAADFAVEGEIFESVDIDFLASETTGSVAGEKAALEVVAAAPTTAGRSVDDDLEEDAASPPLEMAAADEATVLVDDTLAVEVAVSVSSDVLDILGVSVDFAATAEDAVVLVGAATVAVPALDW